MMEDKRLLYNASGELVGKSMIETIKGVDSGKYDSGAFQYCYDSELIVAIGIKSDDFSHTNRINYYICNSIYLIND